MIYMIELKKTIVVDVEADTEEEALQRVEDHPDFIGDPDGTWAAADPQTELLGERP